MSYGGGESDEPCRMTPSNFRVLRDASRGNHLVRGEMLLMHLRTIRLVANATEVFHDGIRGMHNEDQ